MREPGDFPARRIAVHDTFLRCTDDHRLGFRHGGERTRAIAGGDRFLDLADGGAQARAAGTVDAGAAGTLPGGLSGGFRIGHWM